MEIAEQAEIAAQLSEGQREVLRWLLREGSGPLTMLDRFRSWRGPSLVSKETVGRGSWSWPASVLTNVGHRVAEYIERNAKVG